MWETAVENLKEPTSVFVVVQERHRKYLRKVYRLATEIWLPRPTSGQAATLREALVFLQALRSGMMFADDELLVVNCDNGFAPGLLDRLVKQGRDWSLPAALTFPAPPEEADRWSYVDGHPQFQEAMEKQCCGTHALAGAYYFPQRWALHEAVDEAVDFTLGTGHEPYVSHVFACLLGPKISVECRREDWYDWGTPEALQRWREQMK